MALASDPATKHCFVCVCVFAYARQIFDRESDV